MVRDDNRLVIRVIAILLSTLMRIIYSIVGLAMLFIIVGLKEKKWEKPIPKWIIEKGNLCFGVYLLLQFILKGLYDCTDFPSILSCYWLPWVGFVGALLSSFFIVYLIRNTKICRVLIG